MKKVLATVLLLVVAAAALGAGVLAGGGLGYRAFVIRTGSMRPSIPPQSLVLVREGDYAVGDVVSFRKGADVVSHRLVSRNADGSFVTKGDANSTPDVSPVAAPDILGGVVQHVDRLGFWVVYLRSPLTLASLAMLLVFLWAVWPFFFTPDPPSSRARSGETTPPREMAALPESPGSPGTMVG